MSVIVQIRTFLASTLSEWRNLRWADLQFAHRTDVRLMLLSAIGILLILAVLRSLFRPRAGRQHIVLPAIPASIAPSRGSYLVHVPLLLFLLGLLSFTVALGDPHTSFVTSEATFPGRRIGIIVDGSSSMRRGFYAKDNSSQAVFYTTVAAAKRFVELRTQGKYRDLMGLVEFGNEAYVITPFTNDYDNILLSISLIGDPTEFSVFPDAGNTVIGLAIQQGVELFKAFKFLDAAGNLLVVFSDGEDTHAIFNGMKVDDIIQAAVEAKIPVYFVRTSWGLLRGKAIGDDLWAKAIEKTGGRFYAASDDDSLAAAVTDINKQGAGTIALKQYANQLPRFPMFTLAALACWIVAATLKLTVPYFQMLP